MNYTFAISLILHLTFFADVSVLAGRHQPRVMAIPDQNIRWVNIAPPVVQTAEAPIQVKPATSVPVPKPKVEKAATVLAEKPQKPQETKPLPEETIASSTTSPELPVEPEATSQPASGGIPGATGLRVDDPDFNFIYYLNIIRNRIQEHWRPPYSSADSPYSQQVMIAFKITRSGKISDVRIEQSSGNFLFDQAALRALYETATLPPLPSEYGGKELNVHIEFETLK